MTQLCIFKMSASSFSGHALSFYCRGKNGVWKCNGNTPPYERDDRFQEDESPNCRSMAQSLNGLRIAWHDGVQLKIHNVEENEMEQSLQCKPIAAMKFSPTGDILATWQNYSVDKSTNQGERNMVLYNATSGKPVASFCQKKQQGWEPQWSADGKICARTVSNELQFYADNDFSQVKTRLHLQKVTQFSIAPNSGDCRIAVYVPGVKSQPSNVRIYQYPNFGGHSAAIAGKSFFKAERVNLDWNCTGTSLLILTSTETSDSSYYGEQGLHYLSTNGDSCVVPLKKNGPVYCATWAPSGNEFTVVYGYMPAKTTIFNLKNEPVFDFGTGPRNCAYYNPQGNLLCLAGFGNLQGNVEFWDLSARKLIANPAVKDATYFEWCPDGEHVLTATTSPRMRVGNGYKIWHYTGSLMKQHQLDTELWEIKWQCVPAGIFPAPTITYRKAATTETASQPVKAAAYRPPGARGLPASAITKVHEYEPPSNSKVAAVPQVERTRAPRTGDAGKDKRIKNLCKRLNQISKIKAEQAAGKQLDPDQLAKVEREPELVAELESLRIQ